MVTVLYEGDFHVTHQNRNNTVCSLEVLTRAKNSVVIMTELKENPGMSITNASEVLASSILTQFSLDPDRTIFIEHYGAMSYNGGRDKDSYARVKYQSKPDGTLIRPVWSHIPPEDMLKYCGVIPELF